MRPPRALLAVLAASISLGARAQNPPPAEQKPAPDAAKAKAAAPADEPPEIGSWIGNRFLQTASPFVNDKGIFEASFNHCFYESVSNSGGSRLWRLDNGAAVFLSIDYALWHNRSLPCCRP